MVSYKELGLVNSRELFKKAIEGKYAIPAFNFNNMEQMQAIIQACVETKSPVILQVSSGARKYANQTLLRYMAQGACEYAKELGCNIPIVLHLDHGNSFELCKSCVDYGFSSVMIDGSALPYEENVELAKKVVDYAHQYDVTVEGELGVLAGIEDEVSHETHSYTRPEEVEDFVKKRVSTLWQFLSEHRMALISSGLNSAHAMQKEGLFRRRCVSTFCRRLKSAFRDSRLFCTDLLLFRSNMLTLLISLAESSKPR